MLLHFLLFPTFLFAIMATGTFFLSLLLNITYTSYDISSDFGLQGIAGLFFIGILGVVFNFFFPLVSLLFLLILGASSVCGVFMLFASRTQIPKTSIVSLCLLSVILTPLAGSLSPAHDGGLYHLPYQLWLRTEPIVVGIANLHGRFGFGSLVEYISAPLWLGDTFTLLSYLQISFLVFFLLFLIKQADNAESPHLIMLVGVSLNIAIFCGYIFLGYTSTDLASGSMFVVSFIYGHWMLYEKKTISRGNWTIFTILTLSAVLYKISAILLFLWYGFVLVYRIIYKRDSAKEWLIGIAIPVTIFAIYLFRNLISTGCFLYPASVTCLDVPWSAAEKARNDSLWITAWARHPKSGLYSLQDHSWFFNWWLPRYLPFLIKFSVAGIGVCAFYFVLSLINRLRSALLFDIRVLASSSFVLIAFFFWFWKAPTPRFGIGVFILLWPVLLFPLVGKKLEQHPKWKQSLQVLMILCLIMFACRIGSPWKKVSINNLFTFNFLKVPTPVVKIDPVYGVRPTERNQCWLIPKCAPYDRPPKSSWHGYSIFYSE